MRVIAGKFKGKRLKSVSNKHTRPTTDRVKEAVFHMLGPFFDGGVCLDLYAGSGSLGIEAISRGMDRVVFIENNQQAIRSIYENINELHIEQQSEIVKMDVQKALKYLQDESYKFNLIVIDPPYDLKNHDEILAKIIQSNLLSFRGKILFEHASNLQLSEQEGLMKVKMNTYGSTAITIFEYRQNTFS